jgi:hypothetical protein
MGFIRQSHFPLAGAGAGMGEVITVAGMVAVGIAEMSWPSPAYAIWDCSVQFSKKTGVSHTTLHRLERGEHHLTLSKLETVMNKLKIKLSDIFPDEY